MTGIQVIARAVNGFCLARIIVWTLVTGKLFSPDMEFKLSVCFIIIFTIMFVSSLAVRAIVSVILVTFAGKMTKFLMFLAIMSLFVSACTGSVMTNMVESVMGVACKQMTLIELRIQSMEGYAAPLLQAINAVKEENAEDDSPALFSEANATMGTSNKNMNRDVGGQRRKEISKSKSKN